MTWTAATVSDGKVSRWHALNMSVGPNNKPVLKALDAGGGSTRRGSASKRSAVVIARENADREKAISDGCCDDRDGGEWSWSRRDL